jgi:four helix bundle protein
MNTNLDFYDDFLLEEEWKPYKISDRCFLFSKTVINFIQMCKYDRIYFSIFDQLVRSATSIGANVIEGKAGSSKKDWIKFMIIALKSSNETIYWLTLISETLSINQKEIRTLIHEANELSRILGRIILNARERN